MKGLQAVHALLLLSLLSLPLFFARLQWWPLYLLVPLTIYAVVVLAVRPLRRSVHWIRAGRIDLPTLALTLAIIAIASAALVVWYVTRRYDTDLGDIGGQIPDWDLRYLLLAGLGFSIGNALLEEIIFRGVLYEALAADYGVAATVCIQGIAFGVVHAHGFPSGIIGIAMASVYGVVLGILRQRSGGLLAPFVAHVFADATIFGILLVHKHAL
jgi:membrane protease YdiL (CAAX protease family)